MQYVRHALLILGSTRFLLVFKVLIFVHKLSSSIRGGVYHLRPFMLVELSWVEWTGSSDFNCKTGWQIHGLVAQSVMSCQSSDPSTANVRDPLRFFNTHFRHWSADPRIRKLPVTVIRHRYCNILHLSTDQLYKWFIYGHLSCDWFGCLSAWLEFCLVERERFRRCRKLLLCCWWFVCLHVPQA